MSLLKALFEDSQDEIWRQFSREVGGQFHGGGFFTSYVQAHADDWIITLDTYSQGGQAPQTTRIRAPYFNPEGFRFEIYRAGFFTELWKGMGMEDIEVGHPRFDRDFVIQANAPGRVRRLFDNEKIRHLIDAQPSIRLSVKAHEGMLSKFPAGLDELHFESGSNIEDLAQLRKLFDLFAEILQQLCHEGKAYEDDVRIHMRRLRAPGGRIRDGGQIRDKYVIWEGDEPRRDAAIALGRIGDPVAVPALTSVLKDKDTVLIARAIEALARIGDARAIGPLVRRLGDRKSGDGRPIREYVAEALRQLGEGDLVDTVLAALGGDFGRLKAYSGAYRAEIIEALGNAISWRSGTHPANALAEIHAVEALPRLREVLRNLGGRNPTGEAVAAVISRLEARASLPRAASAADVEVDTLPRAAREPGPDTTNLPRRSAGDAMNAGDTMNAGGSAE